jgi:hypothetical protein
MLILYQIRFRVKTLNFTNVKSTVKGIQTMITSETHVVSSDSNNNGGVGANAGDSLRRTRSSSITKEDDQAPMEIIGSINEDGLGLVSWWS